jgi:hypothetical protein
MERPEISFEQLSAKYGDEVARYMRTIIDSPKHQAAAEASAQEIEPVDSRSLLPSETQTLQRLVRYIAANDNRSPALLEQELAENFDVLILSQLQIGRFPDAVEHLLDLSQYAG